MEMEPNHETSGQTPQSGSNPTKLIITVAVILVAVLLVVGAKAFAGKPGGDKPPVASTSSDTSQPTSSSTDSNASYKDGTYRATGNYDTPETQEKIAVTATLKDGKVASISATTDPQAPESQEWQQRFLSGYKQLVVGKPVDAIKLSRVSGSSLTSGGFNQAIESIKDQAKS